MKLLVVFLFVQCFWIDSTVGSPAIDNLNSNDGNVRSNSSSSIACSAGDYDLDCETAIQKLTLDGHCISKSKINDCLFYVVGLGSEQWVSLLIQSGADVNANDFGRTPLFSVTYSNRTGNEKIADLLIKNGANVNAKDEVGITPLHTAASSGVLQMVEFLIEHGSNVNATDDFNSTPLQYALDSGMPIHEQIALMLVTKGSANTNTTDNNKDTPLHFAASSGMLKVVELLLEKDADVNAKNEVGWTPLHLASLKEIAELLMKSNDINVNALNTVKQTPLHNACYY